MQSICWTTRVFSRALRSGFSTLVEPKAKVKPHFVSVACGFPKDILRSKYKLGKFGEDAWFIASTQNSDVIGECFFVRFSILCLEVSGKKLRDDSYTGYVTRNVSLGFRVLLL